MMPIQLFAPVVINCLSAAASIRFLKKDLQMETVLNVEEQSQAAGKAGKYDRTGEGR